MELTRIEAYEANKIAQVYFGGTRQSLSSPGR